MPVNMCWQWNTEMHQVTLLAVSVHHGIEITQTQKSQYSILEINYKHNFPKENNDTFL